VDVYISVPEKPTEYAIIRTKEDLGSLEKISQSKTSPQKKREQVLKKERSFLEKKIHHIRQSTQFFGIRIKSKIQRIFGKKK